MIEAGQYHAGWHWHCRAGLDMPTPRPGHAPIMIAPPAGLRTAMLTGKFPIQVALRGRRAGPPRRLRLEAALLQGLGGQRGCPCLAIASPGTQRAHWPRAPSAGHCTGIRAGARGHDSEATGTPRARPGWPGSSRGFRITRRPGRPSHFAPARRLPGAGRGGGQLRHSRAGRNGREPPSTAPVTAILLAERVPQ